jgi:hypothetical protein
MTLDFKARDRSNYFVLERGLYGSLHSAYTMVFVLSPCFSLFYVYSICVALKERSQLSAGASEDSIRGDLPLGELAPLLPSEDSTSVYTFRDSAAV